MSPDAEVVSMLPSGGIFGFSLPTIQLIKGNQKADAIHKRIEGMPHFEQLQIISQS